MIAARLQIAEGGERSTLADALESAPALPLPVLVNVGVWPDLTTLIERCRRFVAAARDTDALIVTILTRGADTDSLEWQVAAAGVWAFTRHAALSWAKCGMRLNLIGFGVSPPPGADTVAGGRSVTPVRARPAEIEDVVRTVHAVAGWPSMTGQFIRLGGV